MAAAGAPAATPGGAGGAPEPIDVVWLKKDVRLHDHAPLAAACTSGRKFAVVYIYEPGMPPLLRCLRERAIRNG